VSFEPTNTPFLQGEEVLELIGNNLAGVMLNPCTTDQGNLPPHCEEN